MGYIIAFALIGIIATGLAGLAALIAALLPVRSKRFRTRVFRAAAAFVLVWAACVIYGVIDLSRIHHESLSKADGSKVVPGLVRSGDQVLRAERVYGGDTAQTYAEVRITADEMGAFASASGMKTEPFDAHTAEARGWYPPDWWPRQPCLEGVTYSGDTFSDPPHPLDYVINWCPREGRAYLQHFDY